MPGAHSTTSSQAPTATPPQEGLTAQATGDQSTSPGQPPSIKIFDEDEDRMVGERDPQLQDVPSASTVYSRKMTKLGGPGSAAGLAWHPTEDAKQTFRDSYGFERSEFDGLPRHMHPW
jgi:hypothetical protein